MLYEYNVVFSLFLKNSKNIRNGLTKLKFFSHIGASLLSVWEKQFQLSSFISSIFTIAYTILQKIVGRELTQPEWCNCVPHINKACIYTCIKFQLRMSISELYTNFQKLQTWSYGKASFVTLSEWVTVFYLLAFCKVSRTYQCGSDTHVPTASARILGISSSTIIWMHLRFLQVRLVCSSLCRFVQRSWKVEDFLEWFWRLNGWMEWKIVLELFFQIFALNCSRIISENLYSEVRIRYKLWCRKFR